jgi:hypothetical protein
MTYNQLLQSCEFWSGMNPGDISDDTTLKATFTSRLNRSLEKYMGMLGAGSMFAKEDDTNYTNQPFSLFNIVEDQHDYQFLTDEDGNAISDFTAVLIKVGTIFRPITRLSLDTNAELVMSPNDVTGVPTGYIERNNTIFLDPVPNYSLAQGGKVFYKRAPSYFATTDSVKEPGIPFQFHEMLAVDSAYAWLLVHKSNSLVEITRVESELDRWQREFKTYNNFRNPTNEKIVVKQQNNR